MVRGFWESSPKVTSKVGLFLRNAGQETHFRGYFCVSSFPRIPKTFFQGVFRVGQEFHNAKFVSNPFFKDAQRSVRAGQRKLSLSTGVPSGRGF